MGLCRHSTLPYYFPKERQSMELHSCFLNWQRKGLYLKNSGEQVTSYRGSKDVNRKQYHFQNFCNVQFLLLESEQFLFAYMSIWGLLLVIGELMEILPEEYTQQSKKLCYVSNVRGEKRLFNNCVIVSSSLKGTFLAQITSNLPLRYLIIKVYAKKLMMQTRVLHMNLDLFSIVQCVQCD